MLEACARHASYSRAADELGVSPAAVSQRMRDLQAELGVSLFERHGPRVAPTEQGLRLAGRVRDALAILSAGIDECSDSRVIRISAAPTFAARWLAPRLADFRKAHDPVRIVVDAAIDVRPQGSFDVAIRSGRGRWRGCASTRLFAVEGTPLYNPHLYDPGILSSPAGLLTCELVHSDEWDAWFTLAGIPVPAQGPHYSNARYPTQDLAGAAALEGAGVALLSPRLFADAITLGRLIRPFDITLNGPESYWLLTAEGEARPHVTAFCDWLMETIG
ncbi:LysR substrate-binding domain-containing protein [Sphingomonas alpina]|uniref:LysR family transcriptional regulator n=1 Tax=Sphingomonas alpina TaxID=653931 RepID=A0A7H0LN35_9SPHN|nr:LysR substrate-binding domain-containing protein [Sphingomonas alpina]QNQ11088.1 LysR family transcriptional regulator [Sphingomonas alpina]